LLLLFFRVLLGWERARPSPAKAEAMEHTAKSLPAYQGGSLLEHLHGQKLAALSNRLEQMERLERNAAALSEHYAGMVPRPWIALPPRNITASTTCFSQG
jgi:hypothetical protein